MKLGTNDIGSVYLGTNAVQKVYLGTNEVWSAGGGFDADYQAVLDYATAQGYTLPSASQQLLQEQLIIDLKTAGIWSKLDTFAVFATDAEDAPASGTSNFALIDWKRLTQYNAVNSPTFTTNGGFKGNGTSSYIDTNFNPSTSGVNYTLDDAGRFFWVDLRGTANEWEGNSANNNNSTRNAGSDRMRINAANVTVIPPVGFAIDEHHAINRTSSTNVEIFTNSTQYSCTQTSQSVASLNQFIGRGGTTYNTTRFRCYGMGASLVSENTDFYNAMNTYFTSL